MEELKKIEKLQACIKDTECFFIDNKRGALYKHILEMVEKPLLEMMLKKTDGNQKKAAHLLGINRNTLYSKIKKLDIDVEKFKFDY